MKLYSLLILTKYTKKFIKNPKALKKTKILIRQFSLNALQSPIFILSLQNFFRLFSDYLSCLCLKSCILPCKQKCVHNIQHFIHVPQILRPLHMKDTDGNWCFKVRAWGGFACSSDCLLNTRLTVSTSCPMLCLHSTILYMYK